MSTGHQGVLQQRRQLCNPHATLPKLAGTHLSISTVSATSRGRHCCGGACFRTPAAGPTVTVYVTLSARLTRLHTIRCRASGDSGAADEYRSGLREKIMGTALPDAELTG
jgi:hypothetical protein